MYFQFWDGKYSMILTTYLKTVITGNTNQQYNEHSESGETIQN